MEKKLILYGCGEIGRQWLERLGTDCVYAYSDSDTDLIGKMVHGKNVFSMDELRDIKDEALIFISTSLRYKREIFSRLQKNGLEKNVIGIPYMSKELHIDWYTQIDTETTLEGKNALQPGAQVTKCRIGYASYVSTNSVLYNVKIGKYTSVGPNVRVIRGQHPTRTFVSTHPIFYSTQQVIGKTFVNENTFDEYRYTDEGYIAEIGNDVWIGDGVTIMEGVSIADGTIVAAGANVVKNTEPYSIIGGNPARVIRYRFSRDDIEFLQVLQWWNKDHKWIEEHAHCFKDVELLKKDLQYNEVLK